MALPRRFSISIDGKPVGMPRGFPEEMPQAHACDRGEPPAVFEIENDRLMAGPFVLGRHNMEDLSLMPKRVVWCTRDQMHQVQPVRIEDRGRGPELNLNGGRLAYVNDGELVSPLIPDMMQEQRVELRPAFG